MSNRDNLFTMGSCFAREFEQCLASKGLKILSATRLFDHIPRRLEENKDHSDFLNKYNVYAIRDQLRWALDPAHPYPENSLVEVAPDEWFDPHVHPILNFTNREETLLRRRTLNDVVAQVRNCRIVILTLGMAQVWRDNATGLYINTTPLKPAIALDPLRYTCHILDFNEILTALEDIHVVLSRFAHPSVQIVIAVSPISLGATFTAQDVVLLNSYSKSVQRAAAETLVSRHPNVHYFPSMEIVNSSEPEAAWKSDRSHVTRPMTEHIINLLMQWHWIESSADSLTLSPVVPPNNNADLTAKAVMELVRARWTAWANTYHNIYLIGAGAHTEWLLRTIKNTTGPAIKAILDDNATRGSCMGDIPVLPISEASADGVDASVISSDSIHDRLRQRATEVLGFRFPTLSLYEGLPPGPYPKMTPSNPADTTDLVTEPSSRDDHRVSGLLIDPVGYCNLACAMCPRGHSNSNQQHHGIMSPELLKRIATKAAAEIPDVSFISFGNWSEPLLHPKLLEFIHVTKNSFAKHPWIELNTNLNVLPDAKGLMSSGVARINVSISGMIQTTYERNHRGGRIDHVLANIDSLCQVRSSNPELKPQLVLCFHHYLYNGAELDEARRFCIARDITFKQVQPFICPVEECEKFQAEDLTEYYSPFIDLVSERKRMKPMGNGRCNLIDQICVDFDGTVIRCCGVFDRRHSLGNLFDLNFKTIPDVPSPICHTCTRTPVSFRHALTPNTQQER